jgi:type IV pilus assembly protein PilB
VKIGEAFRNAGLINSEALETALREQESTHDRLGDIMLRNGTITSDQIAPVLADYFNIRYIRLEEIYKDIKPEVIDCVPEDLARRFTVIPVDRTDQVLSIAIFDPLNLSAIDTLRIKTGYKIRCVVASDNVILDAIEYCYQGMSSMNQHVKDFVHLEEKEDLFDQQDTEKLRSGANDQPVVQYVQSVIIQAANNQASDIHLQPKQKAAELRFRVDGVLYDYNPPPKAMLAAISTRIKILSGLDISERRLPQDGRFKVTVSKKEIDIRTSFFPTIYGESIVLRLLDTSRPLLGLEETGLDKQQVIQYKNLIEHSYGLILVTGPTGSGKTTTLYASLNEIKSTEKNILTLEDPVEYRLPFIQQSQVNPQIGFDFAKGLRSILRQDPDVIMVGEIRDKETAEIAIHAALTGHLVFATLHTNDAAGAVARMINMGVEPFLISSALLGVVAQRLVRLICSDCQETYKVDKEILNKLSLSGNTMHFTQGKGCPKCLNSGYRGREGIYELLVVNDEMRKIILERRSANDLRATAKNSGMKTLRDVGIDKVKQGITTPQEVLRVTQEVDEREISGI